MFMLIKMKKKKICDAGDDNLELKKKDWINSRAKLQSVLHQSINYQKIVLEGTIYENV